MSKKTQDTRPKTQDPASLIASPRQASHERRATRHAFSLTEVLLAVGTLAMGMLFIAGVFPVSIHFTTVAAERTISASVADEAFAKIKLYGLLPATDANWIAFGYQTQPFEFVSAIRPVEYEFGYPSNTADSSQKYWWSAICRRLNANDVQVTVFAGRKVGTTTTYYAPFPDPISIRPRAVLVGITGVAGNYELNITGTQSRINDGYTVVDDGTGQIYRVLERYRDNPATPAVDESRIIRIDKPWQGSGNTIWVVPPPVGRGRYPCIAVYQKVIRF